MSGKGNKLIVAVFVVFDVAVVFVPFSLEQAESAKRPKTNVHAIMNFLISNNFTRY